MKLPLLIVAVSSLALASLPQSSGKAALGAHQTALKNAQSLEAVYTVQQIGGASAEYRISLGKPGMFRVESPTKLLVSDGKTIWQLNKDTNTYSEMPSTPAVLAEKLSGEDTWGWSAFLIEDQFKDVKGTDAGAKRNLRGSEVLDVTLTFGDATKSGHFYFDSKLGIARGWSIKTGTSNMLVIAKEIKFGKDAPSADTFVFTAPSGATKEDPSAPKAMTFADISPILQRGCGCHRQGGGGGFSVAGYRGVMRAVKPGDPDNSSLVQYLTGAKQPRMPKGGAPLPAAQIDAIKKWIAEGAKE